MKPLGVVRDLDGESVRVCGVQCRVELGAEVHAGGRIFPTFLEGGERLSLFVASRRFGFCARCGADLRPPLPDPLPVRRFKTGEVMRTVPGGWTPAPCRLGSQEWRPEVAGCPGCEEAYRCPVKARPARPR